MKIHSFNRLFALTILTYGFSVGIATFLSGVVQAQSEEESERNRLINAIFQSKEVELPEDFLVKVNGDKLQIALVNAGVIGKQPSTANLLVRLFDSDGAEKTATTNERGIAEFVGVQPNEMHALLVADAKAHAALPLMTVGPEYAESNRIETNQFKLSIGAANANEILSSIDNHIPPPEGNVGEVYGVSEYVSKETNVYKVHLQRDGTLLGRVVVIDKDLAKRLRYANLTFIQNNTVVGRTNADANDGSFELPGLKVGTHTVIAAGPAGYASFAFEVLPALKNRQTQIGIEVQGLPVSMSVTEEDRLYVCLCPPRVLPQITARIRQVYTNVDATGTGTADGSGAAIADASAGMGGYGPGFGGAGFGGGSFGGGGGGFGGGGFGALAGIAGLSAVAGILAADNQDNEVVSPIVLNQ